MKINDGTTHRFTRTRSLTFGRMPQQGAGTETILVQMYSWVRLMRGIINGGWVCSFMEARVIVLMILNLYIDSEGLGLHQR